MKKIDGKECNSAKECFFFNEKVIRHKMKRIQSKKHKLGTYEINKISLSYFDDKRYVLDYGIHTLAYFHKDRVTSCKKIKKHYDKKERIEKDYDKKKD